MASALFANSVDKDEKEIARNLPTMLGNICIVSVLEIFLLLRYWEIFLLPLCFLFPL
jgi:hypothetical protein